MASIIRWQAIERDRAADAKAAEPTLGGIPTPANDARPVSEISDLGNVVPFVRPHQAGGERIARDVVVAADERPAPVIAVRRSGFWWLAFLALSVALHASLYLLLDRAPAPVASIGEETISVEIVLGASTAAGSAEKSATDVEAEESAALEAQQARPEAAAPDSKPPEPVMQEVAEQKPQADQPTPEKTPEPPPPEVKSETPPVRVEQVPQPAPAPAQAASAASDAASGVGRGRSDKIANYQGRVSAQLNRHKRYPAEARRQGRAGQVVVKFSLDGAGNITSLKLVESSGSRLLDQEAEATVRRAAPFPPPPQGYAATFTWPVNFELR